jgi:hypothetical protein
MNWKCRFGLHDWEMWKTIKEWEGLCYHILQKRQCSKCGKSKLRESTI